MPEGERGDAVTADDEPRFQHPLPFLTGKAAVEQNERQLLYGIYREVRAFRFLIIALIVIIALWIALTILWAASRT